MRRRILIESNEQDKKILQSVSEPVTDEEINQSNPKLKGLIENLFDTLHNDPTCVGISANQIGVLQRVFVLKNGLHKIFINPEIVLKKGSKESVEGCLSLPDKKTKVKRAKIIKVSFYGIYGQHKIRLFTGYMAVIIQHEMDHLNGVLI